jgi:hypothetical protein
MQTDTEEEHEMHEIYRTIAADLNRDRVREADAYRLAHAARSASGETSLLGRVRMAFDRVVGQPAAPASSSERSLAGCP